MKNHTAYTAVPLGGAAKDDVVSPISSTKHNNNNNNNNNKQQSNVAMPPPCCQSTKPKCIIVRLFLITLMLGFVWHLVGSPCHHHEHPLRGVRHHNLLFSARQEEPHQDPVLVAAVQEPQFFDNSFVYGENHGDQHWGKEGRGEGTRQGWWHHHDKKNSHDNNNNNNHHHSRDGSRDHEHDKPCHHHKHHHGKKVGHWNSKRHAHHNHHDSHGSSSSSSDSSMDNESYKSMGKSDSFKWSIFMDEFDEEEEELDVLVGAEVALPPENHVEQDTGAEEETFKELMSTTKVKDKEIHTLLLDEDVEKMTREEQEEETISSPETPMN